MKKVYALFLFLILISPMLITYTLHENQVYKLRKKIKHNIISEIGLEKLKRISIHREDIHQLYWKHDKEFEYKDEMYDVVSKIIVEDSIIYYTWWDKEETELNITLDNLVKKQFSNDSECNDDNIVKVKNLTFIESSFEYEISYQNYIIHPYIKWNNEYQYRNTSSIFHPPLV